MSSVTTSVTPTSDGYEDVASTPGPSSVRSADSLVSLLSSTGTKRKYQRVPGAVWNCADKRGVTWGFTMHFASGNPETEWSRFRALMVLHKFKYWKVYEEYGPQNHRLHYHGIVVIPKQERLSWFLKTFAGFKVRWTWIYKAHGWIAYISKDSKLVEEHGKPNKTIREADQRPLTESAASKKNRGTYTSALEESIEHVKRTGRTDQAMGKLPLMMRVQYGPRIKDLMADVLQEQRDTEAVPYVDKSCWLNQVTIKLEAIIQMIHEQDLCLWLRGPTRCGKTQFIISQYHPVFRFSCLKDLDKLSNKYKTILGDDVNWSSFSSSLMKKLFDSKKIDKVIGETRHYCTVINRNQLDNIIVNDNQTFMQRLGNLDIEDRDAIKYRFLHYYLECLYNCGTHRPNVPRIYCQDCKWVLEEEHEVPE